MGTHPQTRSKNCVCTVYSIEVVGWGFEGLGDYAELGTRSFFRGSLSAPHSIFSHGSLTLTRSFFEFPFSLVAQTLVAQTLVAQPVVR
jgi:hypothetical protein